MDYKCLNILIGSLRGGGSEKVCITLANHFFKKGYKVRIITLNMQNAVYRGLINPSIELHNLDISHVRGALFSLKKIIQRFGIENILVFNYQLAILLFIIKFFSISNLRIISRNIIALSSARQYRKTIYDKVISLIIKLLYRKMDFLIAQCQAMKDDLVKEFNIRPEKIAVINNPLSDNFVLREDCWQYPRKKQLLFIGRLEKTKGIHHLLAIFEVIRRIKPDYTLKIIGNGSLKREIESFIVVHRYEQVIEIVDFTLDIDLIYKESEVTLLTSLYEGFPNVLIESIALGTPVVSFNCPTGPSEIIINGENGYLADYLDESDFVKKVMLLIDHPLDRRKIAATVERYYPDKIVSEYEKVVFP